MKKLKFKIKAKKPLGRIKLSRDLRWAIIGFLGLLVIFSSYSVYSASQQPTTIEKMKPIYAYTHTGEYDYQIYLKPNSLFNTTVLYPGQGTYFKKLVDHINMSFTYEFFATQTSAIQGTYKITAQIQTSLWSKDFVIVPTTPFTSNTNQAKFTINFPLNTTIYQNYVSKINEETGTAAQTPVLIIKTMVLLSAETTTDNINEVFSPSIQIPLSGDIIAIDGDLITTQPGAIEKPEQVYQPAVENQRNSWTQSSLVLSIVLVGFVAVTKTDKEAIKTITHQINKIKKKYREWLVEIDNPPKMLLGIENVTTKSLEDLIKTSEELGKPLLYHSSPDNKIHTFYVLDDTIHYQYVFKDGN